MSCGLARMAALEFVSATAGEIAETIAAANNSERQIMRFIISAPENSSAVTVAAAAQREHKKRPTRTCGLSLLEDNRSWLLTYPKAHRGQVLSMKSCRHRPR